MVVVRHMAIFAKKKKTSETVISVNTSLKVANKAKNSSVITIQPFFVYEVICTCTDEAIYTCTEPLYVCLYTATEYDRWH